MPCKQKEAINRLINTYFKYDTNKSYCQIIDCKSALVGNKPSTLRRHFEQVHPTKLNEILVEACSLSDDDENFPLLREKLVQGLIEQVTVNGRPIASVFDSGLQNSLDYQLRLLAKHNNELNINYPMVVERIELMSAQLVEEIKSEVKGRKINLLVDIASRHFRSVLGVNIQYAYEDGVRLRTIGVIVLHCRHEGSNLVNHILELLEKYDVSINQIFSYTSDNGANVLSAGQILNEKAEEYNPSEEDELYEEMQSQANPAMQILLDNNYHANLLEMIGDEFRNKGITSVHGV